MKRLLVIFALCIASVQLLNAQGAIYNDTAIGTGGIAGASIRVCQSGATGAVGSCSPLATLYTDNTLSTVCNVANGCSNPTTADAHGNFSFHAQPGEYVIDITAINFSPFRETATVAANASGPVVFQSWLQLGTVTYSNLPVNAPDGTLITVSQASATSPCSSGTQVLIARHENGQWNCSSAAAVGASVVGVTATPPLASSGGATPNVSLQPHGAGQIAAGPCAYAATAANPTIRALCAQDIPQTIFQAADNILLSGPGDANGNPNFLVTGGGLSFTVNPTGLPTPQSLINVQNGRLQTIPVSANYNVSVPASPTGEFFVFQNLDVNTDGTVVAGDIQATAISPVWAYPPAPTCNANASPTWTGGGALGPQYWFNMAASTMYRCTSSANGFSVSSAMPLGVCDDSGTSVDKCVAEPYGLTPGKRYFLFGDGSSGSLALTGGTRTQDGAFSYASCFMTGGATLSSSNPTVLINTPGLLVYCQTPALIMGSSNLGVVGGGRKGSSPGPTGACSNAQNGGIGGAGGGSGGASTVNTTGCVGGNLAPFWSPASTSAGGGGTAGVFGGAAAGAGSSELQGWVNGGAAPFSRDVAGSFLFGFGAAGAAGPGNGTVAGGAGGNGGSFIMLKAPSLFLDAGSKIICDGQAGGNSGNAGGGGGGGGGGNCVVFTGFSVNGSTGITAIAGAAGTSGTGQAGAAGGAGVSVVVRAF